MDFERGKLRRERTFPAMNVYKVNVNMYTQAHMLGMDNAIREKQNVVKL